MHILQNNSLWKEKKRNSVMMIINRYRVQLCWLKVVQKTLFREGQDVMLFSAVIRSFVVVVVVLFFHLFSLFFHAPKFCFRWNSIIRVSPNHLVVLDVYCFILRCIYPWISPSTHTHTHTYIYIHIYSVFQNHQSCTVLKKYIYRKVQSKHIWNIRP